MTRAGPIRRHSFRPPVATRAPQDAGGALTTAAPSETRPCDPSPPHAGEILRKSLGVCDRSAARGRRPKAARGTWALDARLSEEGRRQDPDRACVGGRLGLGDVGRGDAEGWARRGGRRLRGVKRAIPKPKACGSGLGSAVGGRRAR